MEADKCMYGPQELIEEVLRNELRDLGLDMPEIGDKCGESVKEYLIYLKLEDGKPEDYPGGRVCNIPSRGASILLDSVKGYYHIKTQEPIYTITREDTLEDVRNKIANKPNTYKTDNIGIIINYIIDTKNNSIFYRTEI